MTPPCNSACECPLCEKHSGTGHGAKDPKEVLQKGDSLGGDSAMAAISHILEMVASSMDMDSRLGRSSLLISLSAFTPV